MFEIGIYNMKEILIKFYNLLMTWTEVTVPGHVPSSYHINKKICLFWNVTNLPHILKVLTNVCIVEDGKNERDEE